MSTPIYREINYLSIKSRQKILSIRDLNVMWVIPIRQDEN
jgi:hypothetical protein